MRPIILTIAGSDSSAGAGIQADLKAIEASGGYAATVLTAITAQNTRGVTRAVALAPDLVTAQLDAVFADLDVAAIKTGMLADAAIVEAVAAGLHRAGDVPIVVDPVMVAKGGAKLLDPDAIAALRESVFPLAHLLTPNVHEAEALCATRIRSLEDARGVGARIVTQGARAVLVKGGHLAGERAVDVLVTRDGSETFEAERIDSPHTHGTGCTYSAAIATRLGRGLPLVQAIRGAKAFVTEAIRHGLPVGRGIGPTDPLWFLEARP